MYRVNFKISGQNIPCAAYGKFNHIFIITKNPSTAEFGLMLPHYRNYFGKLETD